MFQIGQVVVHHLCHGLDNDCHLLGVIGTIVSVSGGQFQVSTQTCGHVEGTEGDWRLATEDEVSKLVIKQI